MVKILQRYLSKNVILASVLSTAVLLGLLLSIKIFSHNFNLILSGKLSWWLLLKMIGLYIPILLGVILPPAFMASVIFALSKAKADRELVSLQSAGINIFRFLSPLCLIAVVLFFGILVITNVYAPRAELALNQLKQDLFKLNPKQLIQPKTLINDFSGYQIYVNQVDDSQLHHLQIWELAPNQTVRRYVTAKRGALLFNWEGNGLSLNLEDGHAIDYERDPSDLSPPTALQFAQAKFWLPLKGVVSPGVKLETLSTAVLMQTLKGELTPKELKKGSYLLHQRFTRAYAVLSLLLLAVPIGFMTPARDFALNIGIAIVVAVLLFFYEDLIYRLPVQLPPHWMLWYPQWLLQAVGLWFIYRLYRSNRVG